MSMKLVLVLKAVEMVPDLEDDHQGVAVSAVVEDLVVAEDPAVAVEEGVFSKRYADIITVLLFV